VIAKTLAVDCGTRLRSLAENLKYLTLPLPAGQKPGVIFISEREIRKLSRNGLHTRLPNLQVTGYQAGELVGL
jgi:hypothetical protein